MPFHLFRKIIDEVSSEGIAERIALHVLGEPFIYPELAAAVAYAKSKDLNIVLTTNGSLFHPGVIDNLINSGLDEIDISIQSIDREQHPSRACTIPFEDYYQNILGTVEHIRKNSAMSIRFDIMNTSSRKFFNVNKLVRINQKGNDLKNQLTEFISDIYKCIGEDIPEEQIHKSVGDMKLNEPKRIRIDDQIYIYMQMFMDWGNAFTAKRVYPAKIGYCNYAVKYPGILSDGTFTICCGDFDGKTSLGNVNNSSVLSLLLSKEAQAISDDFERYRIRHPYCQRCFGGTSRIKAFIKGLATIYLFKVKPPVGPKEVLLPLARRNPVVSTISPS